MDNAQNCDSYINMPSSKTYGSYLLSYWHLHGESNVFATTERMTFIPNYFL
jgi:hypothetical protein